MQKMIRMLFLAGFVGCACPSSAQKFSFQSFPPAQFEQVIQGPEVVLVDVRTPEEYVQGHLAGAVNVDVKARDFLKKAQAALPKDKTVAVYCQGGVRSTKAACMLVRKGYKVVELTPGFKGWTEAGKPVEK